jgi:flagellar hook protein FlgE
MFSGVSGLRVHQTKMDVIANNIANVNTVGYKSSRVTFMDAFYQKLQGASGENPLIGKTGTNPMQIGLGVNLASIDNMMTQGMSQRTDNALDVMIQGNGFFIVEDTSGTYFTRAGNISRDSTNNLNVNGMQLMGWDTIIDEKTGQEAIQKGPVVPLNLKGEKQYVPPKATSLVDLVGNLNVNELPSKYDNNNVEYKETTTGMTVFDSTGNKYEVDVKFKYYPYVPNSPNGNLQDHVKGFWTFDFVTVDEDNPASGVYAYPNGDRGTKKILAMHVGEERNSFNFPDGEGGGGTPAAEGGTPTLGQFSPKGLLVFDTDGELVGWDTLNIYNRYNDDGSGEMAYADLDGDGEEDDPVAEHPELNEIQFQINKLGLTYNFATGRVDSIPESGEDSDKLKSPESLKLLIAPMDVVDPTATFGEPTGINIIYQGEGQTIGFDPSTGMASGEADEPIPDHYVHVGSITMNLTNLTQWGGSNSKLEINYLNGNTPGTLQDLSVATDGKITGRYSNGQTKLLGQIAVAVFQNPAGLEKVGSNLFVVTANSGPWNGVGETGEIMGGALEMSNVDLAQEFTEMITTQRGFQANSRTITVSDEMLQELVNLKR